MSNNFYFVNKYSMQRFLFILQIFLKSSMIFFIAFIWLNFFLKTIWLSGLIAFGITLIIEFISLFFKKKNNHKNHLKIKEKEDAENMFLSLLTDKDNLSFFYNLTSTRHFNIELKKKYVLLKHQNNKVILYPFIKIGKLSCDDILEIYKSCSHENVEKIVITCNDYEKECKVFIKNFTQKFVLLDKFETYSDLYKEYDYYPEITIEYKKEAKPKFKDLLAYSFNKSRTKGYLFSAFILFLPSLFLELNIYYCIVGTLLLLFALISFINPKYNRKKEQSLL